MKPLDKTERMARAPRHHHSAAAKKDRWLKSKEPFVHFRWKTHFGWCFPSVNTCVDLLSLYIHDFSLSNSIFSIFSFHFPHVVAVIGLFLSSAAWTRNASVFFAPNGVHGAKDVRNKLFQSQSLCIHLMFGKYQNSITRPILSESFFLLLAFPRSFASIKMQGVGKSLNPGLNKTSQWKRARKELSEATSTFCNSSLPSLSLTHRT